MRTIINMYYGIECITNENRTMLNHYKMVKYVFLENHEWEVKHIDFTWLIKYMKPAILHFKLFWRIIFHWWKVKKYRFCQYLIWMINFISYFYKQRIYAYIILITYALTIDFNIKVNVKLIGKYPKFKNKLFDGLF